MRKKLLPISIVGLIFCLMSTGCWGQQEIDKRTMIVALAIDKNPEEEDGIELTMQVAIPQKIVGGGGESGGGGGGDGVTEIFSGRGTHLSEAVEEIQKQTNYPLFFGHTQTLLVGEEVARSLPAEFYDYLRRNPELRRRLWPIVVQGKAKNAIQVKTQLEQIPTLYLRDMIDTNVKRGRLPDISLGDIYVRRGNVPYQVPALHYIGAKDKTFEVMGLAIYKGENMVGSLGQELSSILLNVVDEKPGWAISTDCPDGAKGEVSLWPMKVKREIEISDDPAVDMRLHIKGRLIERGCKLDLSELAVTNQVEKAFIEKYEKLAQTLVKKAQTEFHSDVFDLRQRIYAYQHDLYEKYDWNEKINEIPIRIQYDVTIERMGLEAK
ncbi:Ger(x)C family spore germination protein [Hazenella sp. IB182353]|uniref:Ger(x)C family spore germination protein n=1 Tax=Polycladospora coralii TaxID=2771432 RepID=UPI001746C3D0|nr:Ger(x)C family spore germination protein [Polycladospora coralii]MBS7530347.1 Ger(x)C family spore germination protein [Polycladospora coralii]